MFRNISLLTVLFASMALISGEAERMLHASLAIQSFTISSLFDPNQSWLVVHYASLALMGLLVLIAFILALRHRPINGPALLASVMMLALLALQLTLDNMSAELNQLQGLLPIPQVSAELEYAQGLLTVVHLWLGYALVWGAFWMMLQSRPRRIREHPQILLLLFSTLFSGLVFIVLVSGVWTSVNNAGLACPEIADCATLWWTKLNVSQLFNDIWAYINGQVPILTADAPLLIRMWHHILAIGTAGLMIMWVVYGLLTRQIAAIRIAFVCLAILIVLMSVSGILTEKTGLAFWLVMAHSGMVGLLMLPLLALRFFSRFEYLEHEHDLAEVLLEAEYEKVIEPKADYVEPAPESLYLRLKSQLKKTRSGLGQVIAGIGFGQNKASADLLEELETSLILADVGMDATTAIIDRLKAKLERPQLNDPEVLLAGLKQELFEMLEPCSQPLKIPKQDKPYVILVVGINGVGKTTTIGKMAKRLQAQGHSVMLAAGDTFRAAAVEQLQVWGERNKIHVVAQHTGADSASVIYDGIQSAMAKGVDVLIADTAGRLHTKSNLMDELKKVKRIMAKLDDTAPHEVLLVLDAGTGQNAISQTALFNEAVSLTGLVLTKLDGTAKGGILFALAKQFGLPIRYIGIGESIDDLQDFDAHNFVDALFVKDE